MRPAGLRPIQSLGARCAFEALRSAARRQSRAIAQSAMEYDDLGLRMHGYCALSVAPVSVEASDHPISVEPVSYDRLDSVSGPVPTHHWMIGTGGPRVMPRRGEIECPAPSRTMR
ncbi:MAG: hypothetical protein JOZ12_03430 [Sinobacteraceae bacterium]|nr:hypothetical protein [Nevskiaceae bacterium]